jgi:tetratricopeptide (TPR) repeat protein
MLEALLVLASARVAANTIDEAKADIERIVQLRAQMTTETDLWEAKTLELLGRIYLAQKQDDIAKDQFDRSLEIWRRSQKIGAEVVPRPEFCHADSAYVYLGLATVGLAEGSEDVAIANWNSAYAVMSMRIRDDVIASRVATMADFYVQHDRDFEAVWFYEKSRGLFQNSLGPYHRSTQEIEHKLESLLKKHPREVQGTTSHGQTRDASFNADEEGADPGIVGGQSVGYLHFSPARTASGILPRLFGCRDWGGSR